MRKQTKLWTCRDGRRIRICDMEDSHLINTIKFLERAHQAKIAWALDNPPCFQGEMAQYYADQEWNALMDSDPADLWPIYENLLEEASRRQLDGY